MGLPNVGNRTPYKVFISINTCIQIIVRYYYYRIGLTLLRVSHCYSGLTKIMYCLSALISSHMLIMWQFSAHTVWSGVYDFVVTYKFTTCS